MTTREKIEVMQAYIEGATIQFKAKEEGRWVTTIDPHWDWEECEYRILPTAQELTVQQIEKLLGYPVKIIK